MPLTGRARGAGFLAAIRGGGEAPAEAKTRLERLAAIAGSVTTIVVAIQTLASVYTSAMAPTRVQFMNVGAFRIGWVMVLGVLAILLGGVSENFRPDFFLWPLVNSSGFSGDSVTGVRPPWPELVVGGGTPLRTPLGELDRGARGGGGC